jgi:hypothetical protein
MPAVRKPKAEIAPESGVVSNQPQFHVLPPPTAAPAKPAIKGLKLGGIKAAAAKGEEKARILNPSPELIATLTQFIDLKPKLTALEGTVKSLSGQAGALAKPEWFRFFHGRAADSSMVVSVAGRDVNLIFQARYASKADADALAALGVGEHFALRTTLQIDMEKMPEEKQQEFVDAIVALAEEHGVSEALTAKQALAPKAGVHAQRHILFTPEQNMKIDEIIPLVAFPKL